MASFLTLSFELGSLDLQAAETACFELGANAVTLVDAHDDPACRPAGSGLVLERLPGELRLWPATRVSALFEGTAERGELVRRLAARLALAPQLIEVAELADRVWEREWLRDSHARRFGTRLWVCPRHETVSDPAAVVVSLDPGLAFGTGRHPSTALCLEWLDAHMPAAPAPAEHFESRPAHGLDAHMRGAHLITPVRVIDYGCGSGILALAAAKLGAVAVHCFDIDPQALGSARDNARGNDVGHRVHVHEAAATLPRGVDLLLANILSGPLCALAPRFADLVAPGGRLVLAGLMQHEIPEVTGAYAAWFDVVGAGERDEWACLAGERH
ncbi:MAG: 50S ribosomal protein L11 methyltransferase [Steroidobacteraceae bacterium]